jgi:hypothetical protein
MHKGQYMWADICTLAPVLSVAVRLASSLKFKSRSRPRLGLHIWCNPTSQPRVHPVPISVHPVEVRPSQALTV